MNHSLTGYRKHIGAGSLIKEQRECAIVSFGDTGLLRFPYSVANKLRLLFGVRRKGMLTKTERAPTKEKR